MKKDNKKNTTKKVVQTKKTGKTSKSYMQYDLQAALKNIRVEDGEECPFKYNPPKFESKKEDNKVSEDKKPVKKFFNKFKKQEPVTE